MLNKAKLILGNREIVLKLLITFALLLVFKAGTYIPVPLIEISKVQSILSGNDFLTVLNAFSGGGLSNFSILALGISPYITSSIVIQMMQMIIPKFKEWGESGEVGKQKLNRVTRYVTIVISLIQALLILFSLNENPVSIFVNSLIEYKDIYWLIFIYMAIVITAGSAFTMWLADLITRHGIGNGSSMIIAAGIISTIPTMFATLADTYGISQDKMRIYIAESIDNDDLSLKKLAALCRNSVDNYIAVKDGDYYVPVTSFLYHLQGDIELTPYDKKILESLSHDYNLKAEVINVLLEYSLKRCNNRLAGNFVYAVASNFHRNGIDTVAKAKDALTPAKENKVNKKVTEVLPTYDSSINPQLDDDEVNEFFKRRKG